MLRKSLFIVIIGLLFACGGQDKSGVKLPPDTPVYDFARQLSEKLPSLDPDENNPLIKADNFTISTGEVIQAIYSSMGNRINQFQNLDAGRLEQIVRQNATLLAERKLIMAEAEKAGLTVTQAEVDSVIQMQFNRGGEENGFQQWLNQNGLDEDFVRNDIRRGLIINQFLESKLDEKTEITEADLQKAYEADKTATVRHILFNTMGKSDSAQQAIKDQAQEVLEKAQEGADFAELAKKYSDDPGSKEKGGLYENFGRGRMVKPFEEAAFNLPIGSISNLVETQYGYHIIKVIDREKEERPFDEVRTQLQAQLKQAREKEVYQEYIDSLKEKAEMEQVEF
jgi:parvulin-like peptidyl-prolyl isomerase